MARPKNSSKTRKPKQKTVTTVRVSRRANKGLNPSRGGAAKQSKKQRDNEPREDEHMEHDMEDLSDPESEDSIQEQSEVHRSPTRRSPSGPPTRELEERIDKLIREGISKAMSLNQSTRKRKSTDLAEGECSDSEQLRPPPKKRSKGNSLLSPTRDPSSSEESDYELEDPDPVVRQSFGLLVGESVSRKLRQKIIADKYIEMFELLPEAATLDQHLVLKTSKKGESLSIVKEATPRFITLDQWNQAFASYISVYITKATTLKQSRNLTIEMLTYQRDVNSLAKQELPWYKYDIQFRRDRSVNPSRFTFAHLRHDLIANLRTLPRTYPNFRQPFRANTGFQNRFQTSGNRYQDSPQRPNQNRQRVPPGFCYGFHSKFGRCNTKGQGQCKFKHICPTCKGRHPLHQCTSN